MNTRKYFKYPIVFGTAALCVFFFAAPANKRSDQPVPPDFTGLSGAISQVRELQAAENAWGFVRQSATWANSNSLIIDSIISSLQSSGILNQSAGTYNFANQNVSGTQYHMQIGVGTNDTVNGAGYSGTKTFSNRFLMWRASDDAKALELFFDNSTDTSGDGALMTYSLNILNGSRFTATAPLVETYVFGSSGSRKQVYSWRDGPLVSGTVPGSLNGRVLLEEMTSGIGDLICVQVVVKVSNYDLCAGGNPDYYLLAYGQRVDSPNQTTAKFGVVDGGSAFADTICGAANSLNYGLFNSSGFISDGNSSGSIPSDFRDGTAINNLFNEIGNTNSGAGQHDDLSKTMIDNLNNGGNAEFYVQYRNSTTWPP